LPHKKFSLTPLDVFSYPRLKTTALQNAGPSMSDNHMSPYGLLQEQFYLSHSIYPAVIGSQGIKLTTSAETKEKWIYTSTVPYVFMAWCLLITRKNKFNLLYLTL
jgi:hypothetical protein